MSVKIKSRYDIYSETEAVKDMWKLYYEFMKDPPISVGNDGKRIIFKYEDTIESLSVEKYSDYFKIKYPEKWKGFIINDWSYIEFDSKKSVSSKPKEEDPSLNEIIEENIEDLDYEETVWRKFYFNNGKGDKDAR